MKVKSAMQHPVTGELLSPGETFDEKGLDKAEIEGLKESGYIADGEGRKAGEKPDLQKMPSDELVSYAKSKGIDTGPLRNRTQLINAINTKEPAPAPGGPQKQAAITFGPKHGTATIEEREVSEEDRKKELEEREKSRKEQEANRIPAGKGGGAKAAPAAGGHARGEK